MQDDLMNKRRALGDGGILGGLDDGLSSIGGALTSGVGELTSAILPPPTTTAGTTTTTSTPSQTEETSTTSLVTPTSISLSTSSTTSSSTSSSSSSTTSSSSSSSSESTTSTTSATTETPTPTEAVVTSDGEPVTITSFVSPSTSAANASTPSTPSHKAFLQNKPLSGAVFGIVGVLGLILIFILVTWGVRRTRRKKLINEAMSFDPTPSHAYSDSLEQGLAEKRRMSISSSRSGGGGSSYGHANFPPGGYYGAAAPPMPASYGRPNYPNYAPPQRSPTTGSNYTNYGAAADYSKQLPQVPNVAYDVGRGPYPQMSYGQPGPSTAAARPAPPVLPQTFGDHDADDRAQTFGTNLKVANE